MLHKFPTDEKRLNKWFECLNDDNIRASANVRNLFVCQKHFAKKFVGANSRLLTNAYPTLFTPAEISNGVPGFAENVNPAIDHNYSRKRHYDHTYSKDALPLADIPVRKNHPEIISQDLCMNKFEIRPGTSKGICETKNQCLKVNKDTMDDRSNEQNVLRVEIRSRTPPEDTNITTIPMAATPKKAGRKRIIRSINKLTPTCKIIYKEYTKAKNQADFYRRAKRAQKLNEGNAFQKMIDGMNPYGKKIIEMQLNLCTKKKKGRRFTLQEKLVALAIMKQSPKCYKFLHKIFILPSSSTLNKMVSRLKIEAGINPGFFGLIKKEVSGWKDSKKYCSIIFDEMALGMGLSYDPKMDKIDGFIDLRERKDKFADHVLVFMARGAVHKWQQPLAYYFCEGATSGPELKQIMKLVVTAVAEAGLKPLVLGCDQGTSFQSAIKQLQAETRREQLLNNEHPDDTIIINENKLSVIFDPSHLIKGIRNNFLTKNIIWKGKISQWKDIIDVYTTDCSHTQTRILHKLNDEHVVPNKIKKMKVKNCVRVLSKSVAAALSYTSQFATYVDGTPVSETLKNTAETVSFFDDLFDSINGATVSAKKAGGKTLRTAVRETSKHHAFWQEAIKNLEDLKFIENGQEKTVPTLKNFVVTLKSYMRLWQVFQTKDLKIMRPRYFNTDPIENYFGQVRAYNYRNTDPTCHNFINTFKSLTITGVIKFHSEGMNCEEDPAEQLLNLSSLFDNNEKNITEASTAPNETTCNVLPGPSEAQNIQGVLEKARKERLLVHSKAYVTGWVIKKILEKNSCSICKRQLTTSENETIHNWISQKEYKSCTNKRKLSYPSGKAVRCFGTVMDRANQYLEKKAYEKNVYKGIIKNIEAEVFTDLVDCTMHQNIVKQYFMNVAVRFTIFNWCNNINKILRGVDIYRIKNKSDLPYFQKLAYEKFLKKLKNKSA
ncbi:uncharacterized protein LOC121730708 [Aricia agestis]|uniref:uncharacterized protein LOC121730708 n=1 Tax=Aricia agestis TaxID=91739 RepID=UPI001C20A582|nr:uncharacterized protein LOC121730708 [Aricia agestis]